MINARFPFLVALFAALFFAFASFANAETIPAVSGVVTAQKHWGMGVGGYSSYLTSSASSVSAACVQFNATYSAVGYPSAYCKRSDGTQYANALSSYCPVGFDSQVLFNGAWTPSVETEGQCYKVQSATCPEGQGWTLSGSSCSRPDCQAGEDRNAAGVCVKDCTGKVGQAAPSPSYEFANDGGAPSVGGCNVSCSNWRQSGGGTSIIPLVMVGDACTYNGTSSTNDGATEGTGFKPKPKEPTSPKDCIGSGQGYIQTSSGVTCVSSGQAPEGQNPVVKTEGAKEKGMPGTDGKPDPNAPDYKKEETTTENKNGTTTEKTTTTTNGTPDGNGGTTCPDGFTLVPNTTQCTKTTVSKSSTSDFCTANPTAKSCLGTEESDECLKNPDRIGCTEKGTPGTTPDIESEDRGTNVVTPVDLAQINSCPQGMLLPKGLGYYDFQPMCDFATGLKPVILAIAWLSAFFIVLGFSQGDD